MQTETTAAAKKRKRVDGDAADKKRAKKERRVGRAVKKAAEAEAAKKAARIAKQKAAGRDLEAAVERPLASETFVAPSEIGRLNTMLAPATREYATGQLANAQQVTAALRAVVSGGNVDAVSPDDDTASDFDLVTALIRQIPPRKNAPGGGPVPQELALPPPPIRTRAAEEAALREPIAAAGERPCRKGAACAIFSLRHVTAEVRPLVEMPPDNAQRGGKPALCVMCSRRLASQGALNTRPDDPDTGIYFVGFTNLIGVSGEYCQASTVASPVLRGPVVIWTPLMYTRYTRVFQVSNSRHEVAAYHQHLTRYSAASGVLPPPPVPGLSAPATVLDTGVGNFTRAQR